MARVQIIVGTVMGTAAEVAEAIADTLHGLGHQVDLLLPFDAARLDADSTLLVCTSNTGMGDLPDNILPFYTYLVQDLPPMAGRRYGLVNLGDSSYPNFAEAGKLLDEAMADLGANRLGEAFVMDAILVDDHADEAAQWALQWGQQL